MTDDDRTPDTSSEERPLGPAAVYQHDHPPVRNIHIEFQETMTFGQRVADKVATVVGSWPFIIVQSSILFSWMAINVYLLRNPAMLKAWDPYPFILLNLVLSFQAAYTGPVVMMSQNRSAEKDRLLAHNDYEINEKAEQEIEVIMDHLAHQDQLILEAVKRLESLEVTPPVQQVVDKTEEILRRLEESDRRVLALMEKIGER